MASALTALSRQALSRRILAVLQCTCTAPLVTATGKAQEMLQTQYILLMRALLYVFAELWLAHRVGRSQRAATNTTTTTKACQCTLGEYCSWQKPVLCATA